MSTSTVPAPTTTPELTLIRLHLMRGGYLVIGVGLALVKWPMLPHAHALPFFEGVTLCLLTAISLLALVGVLHPVRLLPVLLFESAWKVLWLALVALPRAVTGSLDAATTETMISCWLVVIILAAIPWRYTWRTYVRTPGDRWR